jgi:tRNA(Ile)-lysidine synthetase-like protein
MSAQTKPHLVAVSGGIDSMVLLDMLVKKKVPLIVAHVDHGIRSDSDEDRELVEIYARKHDLPFVTTALHLGPNVDEAIARDRRYAWLREQQKLNDAGPIVTAHHVDDLIETIVINLLRGTGWRGLCSLRATGEIIRPLLGIGMRKADVVKYAIENNLTWREDSTNDDVRYLRNYLRHGLTAQLPPALINRLLDIYEKQCRLRATIDEELSELVRPFKPMPRYALIMMGDDCAEEVIQAWLGEPMQRPTLRRILHFAKTARPGSKFSLNETDFIEATLRELIVSRGQD